MKIQHRLMPRLCLFVGLTAVLRLEAAERTFTGAANTTPTNLWSYVGNWNGGVTAPSPGDSLVFVGTPANRASNVNDYAAGTMFSGISITGAAFTLSGNAIQLAGNVSRTATNNASIALPMEIVGGTRTFSVDTTTLSLTGLISGTAGITKTGSGVLQFWGVNNTFTGGVTVQEGSISSRGVGQSQHFGLGTLTVNGGRVNLSAADTTVTALSGSSAGIIENTSASAARIFTINTTSLTGHTFSGTIQNGGTAVLGLNKSGVGLTVLAGANTYTGATTVNAGTLLIRGSLGNTAVTVGTSGTLGGGGSIAGNTVLQGTLSPGNNAPGTLAFGANLTFDTTGARTLWFEGGDLVTVAGQLTLNNNWKLSLQSGFQNGGSVTLFTYGLQGASFNLSPTFDLTNLGFVPTQTLTLIDTGSSIILSGISVSVPEPSTATLCGLAIMAGLGFRSRHSRR